MVAYGGRRRFDCILITTLVQAISKIGNGEYRNGEYRNGERGTGNL